MRDRRLQFLIATGVIFTQCLPATALRQRPDAFVVGVVAESALPETCVVDALVTGDFGGFGGSRLKVQSAQRNEWTIPTTYEGAPVNALRAYLYCPGFQVETVQIPDLQSHSTHRVDLRLTSLQTLPLQGTFSGAVLKDREKFEIVALFHQMWICEFFRLAECGFGPWIVGTAGLRPDNKFSLQLPDLLADRTVGAAKLPGWFSFIVRDRLTQNILSDLVPVNGTSPSRGLRPKNEYTGEQAFRLVERKR